MSETIEVADGRFGCPKCGKHPTRRLYDIIACKDCKIAWGDRFDEQDIERARGDVAFVAVCEWRPFLRPGIWPADPAAQRRIQQGIDELEARQERQERERAEREASASKHIMDLLTEALRPVGVDLQQGDQIRVRVGEEECLISAGIVRPALCGQEADEDRVIGTASALIFGRRNLSMTDGDNPIPF
jgi:hypothetical protein